MLRNCLEEDMCLYHPNAGEKESLSGQRLFQGHSWRTAEKDWVSGTENLHKIIKQHLHHHIVWEGFKEKNQAKCFHQKPIYSIFTCQTQLELQMGLASMVKCNKKI